MSKVSDPAVSIIIPIYNMESYLKGCISSVLQQTYRYFELILVNDGSTDRSLEICQQACQKDDRVILLSDSKRQGVSHARNAGIDASVGKYLFFMDADDLLHPQYLEQLWLQAEKTDADLVMTERIGSNVTDEKSWKEFCRCPYKPHWIIWNGDEVWNHWYQINGRNPVWAKLFRRDSIQNLRFDEKTNIAEDTLFNYLYLQAKPRHISYTESSGYYYHVRENSSSHIMPLDVFLPCIKIKEAIRNRELSRGHREYAYTLERENISRMRLWLYETKANKTEKRRMQKILWKELHNPLLSDLSIRQNFAFFLTCYCLPLNNILMKIRRMMRLHKNTSRNFIEYVS